MTLFQWFEGSELKQKCLYSTVRLSNCKLSVYGNKFECMECYPNYYIKNGECWAAPQQKIAETEIWQEKAAFWVAFSYLVALF